MNKVFIPHIPHRRDADGKLQPTVNVEPARAHGELTLLSGPNDSIYAGHAIVEKFRAGLAHYNYADGDALVALGDPTLIALAALIIGQRSPRIRMLKWDREQRAYYAYTIDAERGIS